MKVKALSEALEKSKSVQNLQKAAKVFKDFITNCTNKSLKSKRRCKTNTKSVINLGIMKLAPILKNNLSNLLIFYRGIQKT